MKFSDRIKKITAASGSLHVKATLNITYDIAAYDDESEALFKEHESFPYGLIRDLVELQRGEAKRGNQLDVKKWAKWLPLLPKGKQHATLYRNVFLPGKQLFLLLKGKGLLKPDHDFEAWTYDKTDADTGGVLFAKDMPLKDRIVSFNELLDPKSKHKPDSNMHHDEHEILCYSKPLNRDEIVSLPKINFVQLFAEPPQTILGVMDWLFAHKDLFRNEQDLADALIEMKPGSLQAKLLKAVSVNSDFVGFMLEEVLRRTALKLTGKKVVELWNLVKLLGAEKRFERFLGTRIHTKADALKLMPLVYLKVPLTDYDDKLDEDIVTRLYKVAMKRAGEKV